MTNNLSGNTATTAELKPKAGLAFQCTEAPNSGERRRRRSSECITSANSDELGFFGDWAESYRCSPVADPSPELSHISVVLLRPTCTQN
ncbi:MAG: hypothetical protein PWP61_843 [Trichococcus sp.]|jgi:hypothetical protein|nr:hypothetical protein [Trichococcus sp.]